jgi:CRISPR-associated endonuclease Csn1
MLQRLLQAYRLGLDLGSNSIGWFILRIEPEPAIEVRYRTVGLIDGGVRIFPDGRDPQSGTSNAVDRRTARSARRRRDRFVSRQANLMDALVKHGLMPTERAARKVLEALDPYELRAKALDGPLPAHQVGRALFHLDQRRGFQSNRKADKKPDKAGEKGAIKVGEDNLKRAIRESGARTLGEFQARLHSRGDSVRARGHAEGSKMAYDFYPTRDLLKHEFNKIWEEQAKHHPEMTDAARAEIEHIIFFQRPLKEPPVGKCALDPATRPFAEDPEGYRCPWAHPLAQRFRILQEVRNLEHGETGSGRRPLSKEQGDAVALLLRAGGKVSFDKLRRTLKLPSETRFNLESEKRKDLKGDEVAERLAKKDRFGKAWASFPLERQISIADRLRDEPDEAKIVAWLQSECGLDEATAARVAAAPLPEGHCRLGLRALKKIVPEMETGKRYHEAAAAAGYDHAQLPTGEQSLTGYLPYYGEWLPDAVVGTGDPRHTPEKRFGKLPNPTVHIGLNQLRKVVNALIRQYGPPSEIVVEFTRALKLSPKERQEVEREQAKNQAKNDSRRAELAKYGLSPNANNMLKMRLWEELNPADILDRKCPYSGKAISFSTLMSDQVDIDHLIPFSKSLDDGVANKVVCLRQANRDKGQKTPFEAFGSSPAGYDWEAIRQRAANLPKNKRWRFEPDAMERFGDEEGFLARQLNETGWLARLAKEYLAAICDPNRIWVIPGRLTAMVRGKWGLNDLLADADYGGVREHDDAFKSATDAMEFSGVKNRADHRHHAIDALAAAMTDRSLFWKMARAYDEERSRIEIPKPWETIRDDLKAALAKMVVSHKPDHGAGGQLHEDTAYGLLKQAEKDAHGQPLGNLVYRKPLLNLNDNEIERIRDRRLRDMVRDHVYEQKRNNVPLKIALESFAKKVRDEQVPGLVNGLSRVRLLKPEKPEYLVPIHDKTGKAYKAYSAGENHCVESYETADGVWRGEAIRVFDANQEGYRPRWREENPGARLVMRVHKGDTVRLEDSGRTRIMVVHRLDAAANRFKLADHNETGNLDRRHAMPDSVDPFRWLIRSYSTLKQMRAEPVRVDEIGRVWRITPKQA